MILTKANNDFFVSKYNKNTSRTDLNVKVSFTPQLDGSNEIPIIIFSEDLKLVVALPDTTPLFKLYYKTSGGTPTSYVAGIKASGTVTLDSGSSGSVDGITVDGIAVMSGSVPYNTAGTNNDADLALTAADVAANINAHTSSPDYTATSSGPTITITAPDYEFTNDGLAIVSSTTTLVTTDVNMAGTTHRIPIVIGSVNNIYMQRIYDDTSYYATTIGDLDTPTNKVYLGSQNWSEAANGSVKYGTFAYGTPVGAANITIHNAQINKDDINFEQERLDPTDFKYTTSLNIEGTLTSTNQAAVRADADNLLTYNSYITAFNGNTIVEGATIDVDDSQNSGDAGYVPFVPVVTGFSGQAELNLPVGTYPFTITKANYETFSGNIGIQVNGTRHVATMVLTAVNSSTTLSETKTGSDDAIPGLLGHFFTKPDGRKSFYDPNTAAYEDMKLIAGKKDLSYTSIEKLRAADRNAIGTKVVTLAYHEGTSYGGTIFECVSNDALVDGYVDDGGSVIITNINDAYKIATTDPHTIDVTTFGAKPTVQFINQKNPVVQQASLVDDCYEAVNNALEYLHSFSNDDKQVRTGLLTFSGHFYLADQPQLEGINEEPAFNVGRGVSVWMEGNASVHSHYHGICFNFSNPYRMYSRINTYYGLGAGSMRYWWKSVDAATEPPNVYSEGVRILNGRKNYLEVETYGYVRGFYLYGKGDGAQENQIHLGDMRNCRYPVFVQRDYGGWANQNTYIGGRCKLDGLSSAISEKPPTNAFIYNNGDNNTFINTNCEGASGAGVQYIVQEVSGGGNLYQSIRLEGSNHAASIRLDGGSTVIEGTYFSPMQLAGLPQYHTRTKSYAGGIATFPADGGDSGWIYVDKITNKDYRWDDVSAYVETVGGEDIRAVKGFIVSRGSRRNQMMGNGFVMSDGGNPSGFAQFPNASGTFMNQNTGRGHRTLALGKQAQELSAIFRGDNSITLQTEFNKFLDLKRLMDDSGLSKLRGTELVIGEWYGIGDYIQGALPTSTYWALGIFQATSTDPAVEVTNGKLIVSNADSYPIEMEDNFITAKGFYGYQFVTGSIKNAVYIPKGAHTDFSYTAGVTDVNVNTSAFSLAGRPDMMLKNTSGSLKTLDFDLTDWRYFPGKIITLYNISRTPTQNIESAPIELIRVSNKNGNRVVLKQGHWVTFKIVEDTTPTVGRKTMVLAQWPEVSYVNNTDNSELLLNRNTGAYYDMDAASAVTDFTILEGILNNFPISESGEVSRDPVVGGWAKVLINNAVKEPEFPATTTSGISIVKISGSTWVSGTDMYMVVEYNGARIEYYFLAI